MNPFDSIPEEMLVEISRVTGIDPKQLVEGIARQLEQIEQERERCVRTPLTDEQQRDYIDTMLPLLWINPTGFTN
jgi:hypothetical protein